MHVKTLTMDSEFQYLDQNSFREVYSTKAQPLAMRMYIEGIKCIKCVKKIESLKNSVTGLANFNFNMSTQILDIQLSHSGIKYADVADALTDLGFRVIPLPASDGSDVLIENEKQDDLVRIGVAGFLAGNIMLLSFAIYFGLAGNLKLFFEWLQLALYLPFVSYVAWPFYKGFLLGLKTRTLSIDGPMAVASLLGFLASGYHLFKGQGSLYFDSLSGFLFLILVTRFFQKQARVAFLKFLKPSALVETLKARLIKGQKYVQTEWVRTDGLKISDEIQVRVGEWIPTDGILLSAEAYVDTSILNGESHYKRILEGQKVEAGSRLISQQAHFSVRNIGIHTSFGKILSQINTQNSNSSTETLKLSDQASQILLLTVLSIAVGLVALGFIYPEVNYFERGLALIILACPCAMAFGTPLAMSLVMRRSQQEGLLLKSFGALESAKKIKSIFLDKTGTMTSQQWQINSWASLIQDDEAKKIILALESVSDHPVANALRTIWSNIKINDYKSFSEMEEIPMCGVRGHFLDQEYFFGSTLLFGKKYFHLRRNGVEICRFQLDTYIRPEAFSMIQNLKNQGYQIFLVSGDKKNEVLRVGQQLGISSQNCYFEMSAQQKADLIIQTPNSMMVGDGANDSLALRHATLGVAVSGGVDLALKSADILMLKNDLGLIQKIFSMSDLASRQVKRNLLIALFYNLVGAGLAIFGFASPFLAALLMPLSSLFILAFTWWGTQQ